jgi:hypothetical protein
MAPHPADHCLFNLTNFRDFISCRSETDSRYSCTVTSSTLISSRSSFSVPLSNSATRQPRDMRWFTAQVLAVLTAWTLTAAGIQFPGGEAISDVSALAAKLSPQARIYLPGSSGFNETSQRWSALQAPRVNISVAVGTEDDVVETVSTTCLLFSFSTVYAEQNAHHC